MNISIFGLGYVGCVSLGCLAQNGHNVIGVDIMDAKIDLINQGKPTIIEKDIDSIIAEQNEKGNISATKNYKSAVENTDVSIICVGTPSTDSGHLNLDYIYNTAKQIGESIKNKEGFHIVVIRSTVLPGTNKKVGEIIEEYSMKKRNEGFSVVSNPEFLREGTAVADYYNPPVTVLGGDNDRALSVVAELYSKVSGPIEKVDIKVAEVIKYVNNSFHALKITFANEVGNICQKLNIDSHEVMRVFGMDKQLNISTYYFRPGFAYGGSCLPKDLKALQTLAHDHYLVSPVLQSIEKSNNVQKNMALNKIIETGKQKIGFLSVSFKAGTDDLRYSPSVELIERLLGKGKIVSVYDKNVSLSKLIGANKSFIEEKLPHISNLLVDTMNELIEQSEVIVIPNSTEEIKNIQIPANKIIIDFSRIKELEYHNNYNGLNW